MLLKRRTDLGWGSGATTLRTATPAMIRSSEGYCTLAWCRSAHICFTDLICFTIISHLLHYYQRGLAICDWMPASYTGGQSSYLREHRWIAERRRKRVTLPLARRAMEPGHLLHSAHTCPSNRFALPIKSTPPWTHLLSLGC